MVDYIQLNKEVFDRQYGSNQLENLVEKVRNGAGFLADAVTIHTSWRGLYFDGLHERLSGKRILELGAGNGLNALLLGQLGAEVVTVDISSASERLINDAASALGMKNVIGRSGDFPAMAFDASSFDWVIGKNFLHHLTHEQERIYLKKVADVLTDDGQARFFEPAVNSVILDQIRWLIPVSGRPSRLQSKAFREWQERDPHPPRDNSSRHFLKWGHEFFEHAEIEYVGSLERFCRLIPRGRRHESFRRWAHRAELNLPLFVRRFCARSQTITFEGHVARSTRES